MKKLFLVVVTSLVVSVGTSQVLSPDISRFDEFLSEVYVGQGALDVHPDTRKYEYLKELFFNRIKYISGASDMVSKHHSVPFSSIEMNTAYNENLLRDELFNHLTFNPFKYNINFYLKKIQIIQFEFSDYVMVIYPQIISSQNKP